MKDKIMNLMKLYKVKMVIIFVITFVAIFGILISALATKMYSLKEGDIAVENIKAPYDIEDTLATEKKKQEVLKSVQDQYTVLRSVKGEVIQTIDNLISKVIEIKGANINIQINDGVDDTKELSEKDKKVLTEKRKKLEQAAQNQKKIIKLKRLKEESAIKLSDENYEILLELNISELEQLKNFLENVMSQLYDEFQINAKKPVKKLQNNSSEDIINNYDNNITDNAYDEIRLEDQKKAQDFIESQFNKSEFSKQIKELGKSIGFTQVRANVVYDEAKTKKLRYEALSEVKPIIIKKDQIIIKEGEPVTKAQIQLLRDLHKLNDSSSSIWYRYLCIGLLIIITMVIQLMYLYKYHTDIFHNTKTIILINLVNFISLLLARTISIVNPYLIPLACAPMLLSLLINDDVAIISSVINTILISAVIQFNVPVTVLAVVDAIIGVIMLKNMDQRSDILYSSVFTAIANLVFVFILLIVRNNSDFVKIIIDSGLAFLACVLAGVLTIGFLPFFESIFDIITTIKLLELSNPNQPLLKKLLIEAPGTYHHSVLVANLSELAAEAVNANSVLARVAAYYHDVGKLKRPYFFKENQRGNNPHDKITPNLSTLIIISHVKDGIELAKQYKVPKVIQDIIEQHHGTSLVKYFYITMKNNSDKPDEVREEDFMYPGPRPMSKEAGIIMLADGVEAAVRSISEPSKGKIEERVNNIIKSRLNEGQLDDCDLTLKDLEKIRKAFLKGLSGIYHNRIEYPKLSEKIQELDRR